jgi:hypothetical protein
MLRLIGVGSEAALGTMGASTIYAKNRSLGIFPDLKVLGVGLFILNANLKILSGSLNPPNVGPDLGPGHKVAGEAVGSRPTGMMSRKQPGISGTLGPNNKRASDGYAVLSESHRSLLGF